MVTLVCLVYEAQTKICSNFSDWKDLFQLFLVESGRQSCSVPDRSSEANFSEHFQVLRPKELRASLANLLLEMKEQS